MARRRNRRSQIDEPLEEPLPLGPSRNARGKKRRRRFLFCLLLLALGVTAATPTIIANTPLRNQVLAQALPAGAGAITSEGAQLGWTGAQTLRNVHWHDADGNPLISAESITLERSLTSLIANRRNLGKIRVVRPVVYLETSSRGSNWETALVRLAEPLGPEQIAQDVSLEPRRAPVTVELEIIEGGLAARDAETGRQWNVQQLNATAAANSADGAWIADGVADVQMVSPDAAIASRPGKIRFRVQSPGEGKQQVELLTERLPLEPLEPLLSRVLPGSRMTGTTSADLRLNWQTPPDDEAAESVAQVQAVGKLELTDLQFTADSLSGDALRMSSGTFSTQLAVAGDQISVDQFIASGDWFNADAQGLFDLNQLRRFSLQNLPHSDATLQGRVDLVKLAEQLPRTLNLRPGVRIDSGYLAATLRSVSGSNGRQWDVRAAVENLRGNDGQREIAWTDPLEAYAELVEAPAGQLPAAQLNRVALRSPFATADLAAVAGGADGSFRFDFSQLADQLGQFVDLTDWQLSGTGVGKLTVRETNETGFLVTTQADFNQIDVRRDNRVVWADRELHLDMQASGQHRQWQPAQLATATVKLQGPDDVFTAELLQPFELTPPTNGERSVLAVRLEGNGPLQRWAGRVRPWVARVPEELSGAATLNAELRTGPGYVHLVNSEIEVKDLLGLWEKVRINEPQAKLSGDFQWQAATEAIHSQQLELSTSTLAVRTRDLSLQLVGDGPPVAQGEIAFRTDLERLAGWGGLAGGIDATWPRGQAVGRILLDSNAQQAAADVSIAMDNLQLVKLDKSSAAITKRPMELWNEPHLDTTGRVVYTQADDRLQISELRIDGQTMQVNGLATIDSFSDARDVQGDVNLSYDSKSLEKLVAETLGPGAHLEGANQARVQFAAKLGGPTSTALTSAAPANDSVHWSQKWNVTGETGWTTANLYGLPLGQAKVIAQLADGQLLFQPLNLAVGQGKVTAHPRVLLDPPPRVLQLPRGPLVTNVAVSEEVTESLLKYAAPMLAGATRAEGEFSIDLAGASVPLDFPKQTNAAGTLTVHRLAVRPGDTTKPMVDLLRQLSVLARGRELPAGGDVPAGNGITINQQAIDVRVEEGRVFHRNLQFLVDDVPVRSNGSVGFDQTLALNLEVPVQEKWVRGNKYFSAMAGQVLTIPVRGTLSSWRIDDKVLTDLAKNAAGSAIESEINRQLEKLLRGR